MAKFSERQANHDAQRLRYRKALELIRDTPFSFVNDSESLRHSCRLMTKLASDALDKNAPPHDH